MYQDYTMGIHDRQRFIRWIERYYAMDIFDKLNLSDADKLISDSGQIEPNLVCNYPFSRQIHETDSSYCIASEAISKTEIT